MFSSVIDLMLNCACFVYIGAWMPFDSFNTPELGITPGRLALLFLAILALRRIPSVLLLYRWVPEIGTWREALFTGHFGPVRHPFLAEAKYDFNLIYFLQKSDGRGRGLRVHTSAHAPARAQHPAREPAGAPGGDPAAHCRVCSSRLHRHPCVILPDPGL